MGSKHKLGLTLSGVQLVEVYGSPAAPFLEAGMIEYMGVYLSRGEVIYELSAPIGCDVGVFDQMPITFKFLDSSST